jgi:hypothetical protein
MIREQFIRCNENRRSNPGQRSIISTRWIVRGFVALIAVIILFALVSTATATRVFDEQFEDTGTPGYDESGWSEAGSLMKITQQAG